MCIRDRVAYWMNPATPEAELANYAAWYENPYQLTDFILMTLIGFLIYGPVMLIGLHALELAPKKAAGTAAGFTGLFGYLGGTCLLYTSNFYIRRTRNFTTFTVSTVFQCFIIKLS